MTRFIVTTIIWVIVLIAMVFVFRAVLFGPGNVETTVTTQQDQNKVEVGTEIQKKELTESSCGEADGDWKECGSGCRTEPAGTPCLQVCVEYCGCLHDDQCPTGYTCQEYVDGVGVCK